MMGDKKNVTGPGTIIGANVKLVGTLLDANEIIVHGRVEGEVTSEKMITITETAFIKGPVSADVIQVAGEIQGSVVASSKLELLPTGKVFGSITAKDLSIRSGAVFVGKSNMPDGIKQTIDEVKEDEKKEAKAAEYEVE